MQTLKDAAPGAGRSVQTAIFTSVKVAILQRKNTQNLTQVKVQM